jgi:hypothetical protein
MDSKTKNMPEKITEKAILICDKGAKPSELKVTSQDFCMAANKLIATENDKKADTNIPNFSACAVTRSQCSPAPIKWEKTAEKDTINDFKILTSESTCQCSIGGKISVQFKGHNEKHELIV